MTTKKKPRAQTVRIKTARGRVEVGGWLSGRQTYLRLQATGAGVDWIEGNSLYRLAKAIVRRFEAPHAD